MTKGELLSRYPKREQNSNANWRDVDSHNDKVIEDNPSAEYELKTLLEGVK